jgi:hypothetical protein
VVLLCSTPARGDSQAARALKKIEALMNAFWIEAIIADASH